MCMTVTHLRCWDALDSSDRKSQFVKHLKKKRPFDVYQNECRRVWVKGVVEERSKIAYEEGRVTWAELFPFPEVTTKYSQGARNRYFPALCRDCAIHHLGGGALKHILAPVQERYTHPGQNAAKEWGPNHPSCTVAPNMRLTTSPSGVTASFPGRMAAREERRGLREMVSFNIYCNLLVGTSCIKTGTRNDNYSMKTRALTPLTF